MSYGFDHVSTALPTTNNSLATDRVSLVSTEICKDHERRRMRVSSHLGPLFDAESSDEAWLSLSLTTEQS